MNHEKRHKMIELNLNLYVIRNAVKIKTKLNDPTLFSFNEKKKK